MTDHNEYETLNAANVWLGRIVKTILVGAFFAVVYWLVA